MRGLIRTLKNKEFYGNSNLAFTLIELLVVIAIIGILGSIVLSSLSGARNEAKIAFIKSNLKATINTAQMFHLQNSGNYHGFCGSDAVASVISTIESEGAEVACYTHPSDANLSTNDWAISVLYDSVAYSVSPSGVVTFDTADLGGNSNWDTAKQRCSDIGKSLPTASQWRALYDATGGTNGSLDGLFYSGSRGYWALNEHNVSNAWRVRLHMAGGGMGTYAKSYARPVRCVD